MRGIICYNGAMKFWSVIGWLFFLTVARAQAQTATSASYLLDAADFQAIDFEASGASVTVAGGSVALGSNLQVLFVESESGMFPSLLTATAAALPSLTVDFDKIEVEINNLVTQREAKYPWVVQAQEMAVDSLNAEIAGLSPGIMAQTSNSILVSSNAPMGYAIYAQENQQPVSLAVRLGTPLTERNSIPDTTCDDGTCTIDSAGVWDDPDVAGFGYSVVGLDSLADFANGTKYRPFASASKGEAAVKIAEAALTGEALTSRQTQVIYRASVAAGSEAGIYTNSINYTFVPSL